MKENTFYPDHVYLTRVYLTCIGTSFCGLCLYILGYNKLNTFLFIFFALILAIMFYIPIKSIYKARIDHNSAYIQYYFSKSFEIYFWEIEAIHFKFVSRDLIRCKICMKDGQNYELDDRSLRNGNRLINQIIKRFLYLDVEDYVIENDDRYFCRHSALITLDNREEFRQKQLPTEEDYAVELKKVVF